MHINNIKALRCISLNFGKLMRKNTITPNIKMEFINSQDIIFHLKKCFKLDNK